eukprot:6199045-Pleurochrysis_carterae.AAC.1
MHVQWFEGIHAELVKWTLHWANGLSIAPSLTPRLRSLADRFGILVDRFGGLTRGTGVGLAGLGTARSGGQCVLLTDINEKVRGSVRYPLKATPERLTAKRSLHASLYVFCTPVRTPSLFAPSHECSRLQNDLFWHVRRTWCIHLLRAPVTVYTDAEFSSDERDSLKH